MAKSGGAVRYSADAIKAMIARGEDRTDWAKVDATSEAEIERDAVEDDSVLPEGWESDAVMGLPAHK